ncbi:hypothetical protein [Streptomyces sp. NPDC087300]|uniref:hypothetical protein n=1 Tax=Streptomyces sp. NPDC087300 TaxID=3365780 RepID=UPI003811BC35
MFVLPPTVDPGRGGSKEVAPDEREFAMFYDPIQQMNVDEDGQLVIDTGAVYLTGLTQGGDDDEPSYDD